ncbi:MAG: tetraacyldisaccharide 4'-kinase [bacterium]
MNNLSSYVEYLWNKTTHKERLLFFEKIVFFFLCCLEPMYKMGFFVVCFFKKKHGDKSTYPFKIISVGNLSIGGTGKSVVTQFLVRRLGSQKIAIAMRGYKSKHNSEKNFLVHDEKHFLCNVVQSGDEAYMAAAMVHIPVVVGSDRYKSCKLLEQKIPDIDIILFDDAYQNFSVKKDFQILLLDARAPFENHHWLPAGRLREKDISRADVIILTHANKVSEKQLDVIRRKDLYSFNQKRIFAGKHALVGVIQGVTGKNWRQDVQGKKFLITAGVGSWDGFLDTISDTKIIVVAEKRLENHHTYSKNDIRELLDSAQKNNADGIMTTYKDWYKIEPYVALLGDKEKKYFYVLQIEFEFLLEHDYASFEKVLKDSLKR